MTLTLDILSFNRPNGEQLVTRLSTGTLGEEANGSSYSPRMSADGHYLVFESLASNLGAPVGYSTDIFRKDLRTGQVELVSMALDGGGSSKGSYLPAISADGRFVSFLSDADNLVTGDTSGHIDVYFREMGAPNGPVIRITEGPNGVEANNFSVFPSFIERADGRFLIFQSAASNLVSADFAGYNDIFLKNLSDPSAPLTRLSLGLNNQEANQHSNRPAVSADGRYAVFESYAWNLVAGTTLGDSRLYRIDLVTKAIEVVSKAADGSIPASGKSSQGQLSANGRYVVFTSASSDLTAGDGNGQADVFRKDLADGSIDRIFTGTHAQGKDGDYNAQISADGRYVLFETDANDLVAGDTNASTDVFRKDMVTGLVERLSVHVTEQANGASYEASFVGDGRFVVMTSVAKNLVAADGNGRPDIFLVDADRIHDAQAMKDGRVAELKLGTGAASSVDVAWGDGVTEVVSPSGGAVSLSHIYAAKGSKDVVITVHDGSLTRAVHHALDGASGTFGRNTALADTLTGGNASDVMAGDAFANIIVGNVGDDRLSGAAGADSLDGGAGNDTLDGGTDGDSLTGGAGGDALDGGTGADNLMGDDGNDTLDGGMGADRMTGGAGDDTYQVDDAADVIVEAAGGGSDTAIVSLDFNMGALANVETIKLADGSVAARVTGGAGNDHLVGNTNFNIIDGSGGSDTMEGAAGSDVFIVDNAADVVVEAAGGGLDSVQASVSYALAAGAEVEIVTALGANALSLTGSDSANTLHGNGAANALMGQGGNDIMDGGLGNDSLTGGFGDDILHGGAGKDQLWGDTGRDTFVFDTRPNTRANLDKVRDFLVKDDSIWLSHTVMPKLGRRGSESHPETLKKAFFAIDTAKDGNDYVIYKKSTGALYYDPDGSGSKAAVQIATLSKHLKIKATDFFVV